MISVAGHVWLGFVLYTTGVLLAGLSIHLFSEHRRTKEKRSLWLGVDGIFLGFLLVMLAKVQWNYTPIGDFFIR
jgi:hypothetical protein